VGVLELVVILWDVFLSFILRFKLLLFSLLIFFKVFAALVLCILFKLFPKVSDDGLYFKFDLVNSIFIGLPEETDVIVAFVVSESILEVGAE